MLRVRSSDITSTMVVKNFEASRRLDSTVRSVQESRRIANSQRQKEREILNTKDVCPLDDLEDYNSKVRIDLLSRKMKQEFYNPVVMKLASCTIQSMSQERSIVSEVQNDAYINVYGNLSAGRRTNSEKLDLGGLYFNDMKKIGAESVDGVAILASIESAKDSVVIKVPRNPNNTEFVHELFVGTRGTNTLRQYCPNFAYVAGGFECPTAYVDPVSGEVTSICSNPLSPSVQYILYENIAPAVSFRQFVQSCYADDYLSAMLQIMLATQLGYEVIDWTHYDLHDENVLMRQAEVRGSNEYYIRFPLKEGDMYVKSSQIATIIDFGRCHFKIDGQHYGYSLPKAGIEPDRSFPIFDVYKLLMFSSRSLVQDGDVEEVAEAIYSYFNSSENLFEAVDKQNGTYFQLPDNVVTRRMNIPDLVRHLWKKIPDRMEKVLKTSLPKDSVGVGCGGEFGKCANSEQVKQLARLDGAIGAYSVLDYFDQKMIFLRDNKTELSKELHQSFEPKYSRYIRRHARKYNSLLSEYLQAKKNAQAYVSSLRDNRREWESGVISKKFESATELKNLQGQIYDVLKYRSLYFKTILMIQAGYSVSQEFGDKYDKYRKEFEYMLDTLNDEEEKMHQVMYTIGQYAGVLKQAADKIDVYRLKSRDLRNKVKWFSSVLPSYVMVFGRTEKYSDAKRRMIQSIN